MRPKILIFEWIIGGGLRWQDDAHGSMDLYRQAQKMWRALCMGFEKAGFHVVTVVDRGEVFRNPSGDLRISTTYVGDKMEVKSSLVDLANQADFLLLVAPEIDGCLEKCLGWVEEFRPKWLNPSLELTRIASNKNELFHFFASKNVGLPQGCSAIHWNDFFSQQSRENVVIKPVDGCGGEGIRLVVRSDLETMAKISPEQLGKFRIEECVSGISASTLVMRSNWETTIFPPLQQEFIDGRFGNFLNCQNSLCKDHSLRATNLTRRVLDSLPKFTGIIGVDMVIGEDEEYLIEVNPRAVMSVDYFWQNAPEILVDGLKLFR
ncbi:MAG: ATP-grasp domain-containing protein [Planctomycetota bacterium]